jgi:hypothetical protein
MLIFNEGHEKSVSVDVDDEKLLGGVFCFVVMFRNGQQATPFDVKDSFFKGHPTMNLEPLVFVGIPGEKLHDSIVCQCVPNVNRWVMGPNGLASAALAGSWSTSAACHCWTCY